jgi:PKHD-type hydroxylase
LAPQRLKRTVGIVNKNFFCVGPVATQPLSNPHKFKGYDKGMHYGNHIDNPFMSTARGRVRTDLSMTLFLSEPDHYSGGELILVSEYGEEEIKLPAGHAVVYSSTMVHRVEPVTEGCRLACITWIQSLFPDERIRSIVAEIHAVVQALSALPEQRELVTVLSKNLANLMRIHAAN